jgi:hypothetical protein
MTQTAIQITILDLTIGWFFGLLTAGCLIALADRLTKTDRMAHCRCFICEPPQHPSHTPIRHWQASLSHPSVPTSAPT